MNGVLDSHEKSKSNKFERILVSEREEEQNAASHYMENDEFFIISRRLGARNKSANKIENDIKMLLQEAEENPNNLWNLHNLDREYRNNKQVEHSKNIYLTLIENLSSNKSVIPRDNILYASCYFALGEIYEDLKEMNKAIETFEKQLIFLLITTRFCFIYLI